MAKTTKSKVAICNIVISVLCLLSIVAYFVFPLWRISLDYVMTAEMLQPSFQSKSRPTANVQGKTLSSYAVSQEENDGYDYEDENYETETYDEQEFTE